MASMVRTAAGAGRQAGQIEEVEPDKADGAFGPDFKPMTADEAAGWRSRQTPLSPWRVVLVQAGAGGLAVLVAWLWGGLPAHAWSAAWGALSVIVPAMLLARALSGNRPQPTPSGALLRLMMWEAAKVVATLAMLLAAPRVVPQLSWLALVASFVVTMKMYWVVWWVQSRRGPAVKN